LILPGLIMDFIPLNRRTTQLPGYEKQQGCLYLKISAVGYSLLDIRNSFYLHKRWGEP